MKMKKKPMRRCIGCMESKDKQELIRIAGYEGNVTIDETGRAKGRGVYLCKDISCFTNAVKRKSFARNLKMEVKKEDLDLISDYMKEKDYKGI